MTSRAVWIALVASLGLNLFGLGAFVGVKLTEARAPHRDGPPPAVAPRGRNPLAEAVRALPPEAQAAWRAENHAFAEENGPRLRETRRQTREALMALGAEPLDAETALAQLRAARAAEQAGRAAMDARLVAFAARLPPEDRSAFAEALAKGAGRGGPPMRDRENRQR
jgi:uncharacterized membrane protein